MYFLISNLLFCEFISTTNMSPSMLYNILSGRGVISYVGCLIQINVLMAALVFETFLLTFMSFDRYLAICLPLRYSALMHNRLCLYLIIVFWIVSLLVVATLFYYLMRLEYCGPVSIESFFCEYTTFTTACVTSDTGPIELTGWVISYLLNVPFMFIVLSYILIIFAILRIKSSAGRKKSFSTCSSHLLVVSIYFGIPFASYMVPMSFKVYNGTSFIYYLVLPMLNPIIYSLRNKNIHKALQTTITEVKLYCNAKIHS
ncbi:olfactory receptor 1D2-like [Mantella aurantiaca]